MRQIFATALLAGLLTTQGHAAEIAGPARFCGDAPVIDLLPGERITTIVEGTHETRFRWDGEFGSLMVRGIGWAIQPKLRLAKRGSEGKPTLFRQRRVKGGYETAIWNGANGAAYFSSPRPFSQAQLKAIERVGLYQEGQRPKGC